MKNGEVKKGYSRFAVLYVGSALIFLVILLLGFTYLILTYLPDKGRDQNSKPKYGQAYELQKVTAKGKSFIAPVLSANLTGGGEDLEQAENLPKVSRQDDFLEPGWRGALFQTPV